MSSAEKAAEEAVRASEQRFRSIFDNAAVGIAHVGLDGQFLRVNHKLCQITGYDTEELVSMSVAQVTHPDDAAIDREQLLRLRSGEIDTFAREKRYLRKGGAVVWAGVTVSLLRTPGGEPLHFIAAVEDISERKAALDALEQERQFIERLTDVVPSILYVFDLAATSGCRTSTRTTWGAWPRSCPCWPHWPTARPTRPSTGCATTTAAGAGSAAARRCSSALRPDR
jgi:PAS domain S-box-containing protein